MDFQQLADVAEKWCSNTPFELIATEETERRMDFYADPGVSFYVLCPDNGCGDNFVSAWGRDRCSARVWTRSRVPTPELWHAGEAVGPEDSGGRRDRLAAARPAALSSRGEPLGPARRRRRRSGWGRWAAGRALLGFGEPGWGGLFGGRDPTALVRCSPWSISGVSPRRTSPGRAHGPSRRIRTPGLPTLKSLVRVRNPVPLPVREHNSLSCPRLGELPAPVLFPALPAWTQSLCPH